MSQHTGDPSTQANVRRTVLFSGRVQGVGFRYTTCQIAKQYHVTGYVQNLPDGRVRLVTEGAADQVEAFVKELAGQMDHFISDFTVKSGAGTGEFGQPGRDPLVIRFD